MNVIIRGIGKLVVSTITVTIISVGSIILTDEALKVINKHRSKKN